MGVSTRRDRPSKKGLTTIPSHFRLKELARSVPNVMKAVSTKILAIAKSWKSGDELEVEMRWRCYKTALIIGHSVYRISGHKLKLLEEQVSRHPVDWQPPQN